jgi:hypothetical protein
MGMLDKEPDANTDQEPGARSSPRVLAASCPL